MMAIRLKNSSSQNFPKWIMIVDLIGVHDLESALKYSFQKSKAVLTRHDHVRVGSVIFLVSVGSLVCWKLWDYWKNEEGIDPECDGKLFRPKSPEVKCFPKKTSKRTRKFLASFLEEEFVQDIGDLADEDPALIQQMLDLLRIYLKSYIMGFQTSDQDQYDNLPYDDASKNSSLNPTKKVRRRHRLHGNDRSSSSSPSKSPYNQGMSRLDLNRVYSASQYKNNSQSKRSHPCDQSLEGDFSSSEVSPRMPSSRFDSSSKLQRKSRISPFATVQRRQGDGSETPDSEEFRNQRVLRNSNSKSRLYANNDSDNEDWISDARIQPDGEEEDLSDSLFYKRKLSRDISMSDFMDRLRQKNSRRSSLTREDSIPSRLSDFLRRDESICSNLSEYCASECSEFSLELSCKDDSIANETITYFADIEDELSNLKYSVNEIDEEFERFTSIPNPYLLRTTFSDYSLDSDSRPSSSLDLVSNSQKPRFTSKFDSEMRRSFGLPEKNTEIKKVKFDLMTPCSTLNEEIQEESGIRVKVFPEQIDHLPPAVAYMKSKSKCEMKYNVNDEARPELHEFNPLIIPCKKSKTLQKQHSSVSLKRTVTQEEALNSLEWDNDCLKQYKDENISMYSLEDPEKNERSQILPDHASLELDLETELRGSPSTTAFSGREAIVSSLNPDQRNAILNSDISDQFLEANPKPSPPTSLPLNKSFISMTSSGMGSSMNSSGTPSFLYSSTPQSGPGMTTSIDSAIHSTSASRSGSSSPLPLMQSMMSSGLGASWSEISPDSQDQDLWDNQKCPSADSKLVNYCSSEERGHVELECGLEASGTHLSPVHEVREKEHLDTEDNFCNNNIGADTEEIASQLYLNDNEFASIKYNDFELHTDENEARLNYSLSSSLNTNTMGNTAARTSEPQQQDSSKHQNLMTPVVKAVDDKIKISIYADQEWRGSTSNSKTIRQGYSVIPEELELEFLRRIRGDNYCGVRAVTYQILTNNFAFPSSHQTLHYLISEINKGSSWLRDYSFGRRLNYTKDQVVDGFKECLETLDKMTNELTNCENRDTVLQSRLNEDPILDVRLCEAVKLNMLVSAMELYKQELNGDQVPLFSMIMFARQNCSNPRELMLNHLNLVGDSAGLEQIEMFLLGYSLQIIIQVVRPSCYGQEDFICYYPDEHVGVWPEVTLVAEDDRHYNVLVK